MIEDLIKQAAVFENEYLKRAKSEGRKVLGYHCVATPVEVIEAAGLFPYRIRGLGNSQTDLADAHLSRFNCSFCRSMLQLGLDGTYDFLDGMIETNGCDHLRGMIENWDYTRKFKFLYYVKVPHLVNEDTRRFFAEEVGLYREALEGFAGARISDDALWTAIKQHDSVREKLRAVYVMRERERPAFTGAETLSLFLLASAMPAAVFEPLLTQVIAERKDKAISGFRARLLLGGSATDEVDLVREIEGIGGLVVADMLCFGSRAFWPMTGKGDGDPVQSISDLYLDHLLCPRMFDEFPSRRDYLLAAVARAKVDGVILVHNKFCDIHGVDNVQLRLALEAQGTPVLQLEKEYGAAADLGRMKTRVQAFLERIGEKK